MMVCCIESVYRKKEACSEDNPAPHDKRVNKCGTTVCIHHKKWNEWNHICLAQGKSHSAYNGHIQPETSFYYTLSLEIMKGTVMSEGEQLT